MATDLIPMSDLAIPPGEYLEEVLDSLGMSKDELAQRMGRPSPKLSAIFNGSKAITPETALQLERATGVTARIWSSLEAEYRLIRARQKWEEGRTALKGEDRHVEDYGYESLIRLGMVADVHTPAARAEELRRYFGVAALSSISTLRRYEPVFRSRRGRSAANARAMAGWLRYAEIRGQHIECASLDRRVLLAGLGGLRALSCGSPQRYLPALRSALARLGVAFVFMPPGEDQGAFGAVFWLGPEKAVILLQDVGLLTDGFWLGVFHALAHILLHAKAGTIIEWDQPEPGEAARELEAGRFAMDALVDPGAYGRLVGRGSFSRQSIVECAAEMSVHPALVLCRLQLDGFVPRDSPSNRLRHRVNARALIQDNP